MKIKMRTPRLLTGAAFNILMLVLCLFASGTAFAADPPIPSGHIRIH